jgi:hypothetical protein
MAMWVELQIGPLAQKQGKLFLVVWDNCASHSVSYQQICAKPKQLCPSAPKQILKHFMTNTKCSHPLFVSSFLGLGLSGGWLVVVPVCCAITTSSESAPTVLFLPVVKRLASLCFLGAALQTAGTKEGKEILIFS